MARMASPFINEFLSATLLMMVCGMAAVALGYGRLPAAAESRRTRPAHGNLLRRRDDLVSLWIGEATGNLLEEKDFDATVGMIVAGVLAAAPRGGHRVSLPAAALGPAAGPAATSRGGFMRRAFQSEPGQSGSGAARWSAC